MSDIPTCWIIAGPNGAGKTTFALRYLPQVANCRIFVNADAIAAGLSPLQTDDWQVKLIYLALPNVTMSKMRVAERVLHGGHNIPQQDLERRFPRSLQNLLTEFSFVVNSARCYMNSSRIPEPIFVQQRDNRTVINQTLFNQLIQQAGL
jgi:predicted ABC-type ATPase